MGMAEPARAALETAHIFQLHLWGKQRLEAQDARYYFILSARQDGAPSRFVRVEVLFSQALLHVDAWSELGDREVLTQLYGYAVERMQAIGVPTREKLVIRVGFDTESGRFRHGPPFDTDRIEPNTPFMVTPAR